MGYRIRYGGRFSEKLIKTVFAKKENMNFCLIALYLVTACVVLLAVYLRHGSLLPIFIPGDPDVTVMALKRFREGVAGGVGFAETVTSFCRAILENTH